MAQDSGRMRLIDLAPTVIFLGEYKGASYYQNPPKSEWIKFPAKLTLVWDAPSGVKVDYYNVYELENSIVDLESYVGDIKPKLIATVPAKTASTYSYSVDVTAPKHEGDDTMLRVYHHEAPHTYAVACYPSEKTSNSVVVWLYRDRYDHSHYILLAEDTAEKGGRVLHLRPQGSWVWDQNFFQAGSSGIYPIEAFYHRLDLLDSNYHGIQSEPGYQKEPGCLEGSLLDDGTFLINGDSDFPIAGVLVRDVAPGSPAEKNRLRQGDLIIKVNNMRVKDVTLDLRRDVYKTVDFAKKSVQLEIIRGGKSYSITTDPTNSNKPTTIEPTPTPAPTPTYITPRDSKGKPILEGILLSRKIQEDGIAIIAVVVPGSPAEKAHLQAGDEIITVNGHVVSLSDFERLDLENEWGGSKESIELTIFRSDLAGGLKAILPR